MLEKTGDLIPVRHEAVNIPWTKRKSQVLNFIHRGTVRFEVKEVHIQEFSNGYVDDFRVLRVEMIYNFIPY